LNRQETEVWLLWFRLQQLREMDAAGQIKCYVCGSMENYTRVYLRTVVSNVCLPLKLITENNYFCCYECNTIAAHQKAEKKINRQLKYNLRQKIRKHKPVHYSQHDLDCVERKLRKLLKNHDYEQRQ
jgi:hypothetical protein